MLLLAVFMACLVCLDGAYLFSKNDEHIYPEIFNIVKKRGYPAETHHVTTSDGYILSMYRIPHGKNSKIVSNQPVLLLHGIYSSADLYFIPESNYSLGYILADNGYDIWLGNLRGNQYSRNHTSLNPDKDPEFWYFSFHEMGMFDLPAMIDYVLDVTNQTKLYYIGHSQGATIFYVLATTRPEYNTKIIAQISLAPMVYTNHITSPYLRMGALFQKYLKKLFETLEINEIASRRSLEIKVMEAICCLDTTMCRTVTSAIFGYDIFKLNTDPFVFLRFNRAGGSVRTLLHFLQLITFKCFRWYDYGEANLKVYGTGKPPLYNLSLVTTPTYLFYSHGDDFATEGDVIRLCKKIRSACIVQFLVPDDNFSHVDFVYSTKAPQLVYQKIISVMQKK